MSHLLPPFGRIEFEGIDPFYRPAGAPIKPSMPEGVQSVPRDDYVVDLVNEVLQLSGPRRLAFIDQLACFMCLACKRRYPIRREPCHCTDDE